ncbi:MAG TPA: HAD-IIA family hydrolase [Anaerolineae bacterium]|nr:HAD family hydrolase [Anaerolineae bacterium]MCB0177160.1 HAD family hydrolase [Anaerolineae bacterium]MCB0224539.1 HAD family hydrolase [Anaerolineae bacterium]MCB9104178.1 HAD family hydrolase [Anaerolineales bacterium]HRV96763.1 HAD-IIA family hydrolase [Anaerolineae bacterium]
MSTKKTYLCDMDGVLVHGQKALPGAIEFIEKLIKGGHRFLILTNNSRYTTTDLQHRLQASGIDVKAENIYNSALAAAAFVHSQKPGGSAYVIGDIGLYQALADVGYTLTDYSPDYVILGETDSYPYDKIIRAIRLISQGIPFIATNPDPNGPVEDGLVPATGAVAALIESATGFSPYFVGKPNPLIMRSALRYLDEHSENAIMIGDRMDTDIKVGLESGLETILVLTGVTTPDMIDKFPYRPNRVVESIADVEPEVIG